MKRLFRYIKDAPYALAAAATIALADDAKATSLGDTAKHVTDQFGDMGRMATGGSFVAGLFFLGTGLMKFKEAAESNGQRGYGPGFWRVGVGALMVAIPGVAEIGAGTFDLSVDPTISAGGGQNF